jgi:hypothetical protein
METNNKLFRVFIVKKNESKCVCIGGSKSAVIKLISNLDEFKRDFITKDNTVNTKDGKKKCLLCDKKLDSHRHLVSQLNRDDWYKIMKNMWSKNTSKHSIEEVDVYFAEDFLNY